MQRSTVLLLAALFMFVAAAWIAQWAYSGTYGGFPLRTNRLTGTAQVFVAGQWRLVHEAPACDRLKRLPAVGADSVAILSAACANAIVGGQRTIGEP